MSVLTATIAKGLPFFSGTSSFRTHDDSSDNKVAGVYSHNALEFSATEADEWTSWMMYINALISAGIGSIVGRNESGGTFLKGTLVYISGVNALVEAGDAAGQLSSWVLNGLTLANTNGMKLYWTLTNSGSDRTVNLYSDPGMTTLVATGTLNGDGSITITDGGSGSGISGSVTVAYTADDTNADGANILSLNVPLFSKADPADVTKVPCYVLDADLATATTGVAYSFRDVTGLDTSGYAAVGSKVYASGTPGATTPTAPTTCDQCFVGIVTEKHATSGSIRFFTGLRLVEKFGARTFQGQATFNANAAYGAAATFGTNAAGGVSSYSNAMVAPTTSPADVAQVYCADFAAGDARMYARYESMAAGSPMALLGLAQIWTAIQTHTANVSFGTAAFGTNAAGGVSSYSNGMTAPTTAPTDVAQLYAADFGAGDCRLYAWYEGMGAGSPIALLGKAQAWTAIQTHTANVSFGTASFGTNAAGGVSSYSNGMTAPTTAPADVAQLYAADFGAGDCRLYAWYEGMSAASPIALLGKAQTFTTVQQIQSAAGNSTNLGLAPTSGVGHRSDIRFYDANFANLKYILSNDPNAASVQAFGLYDNLNGWVQFFDASRNMGLGGTAFGANAALNIGLYSGVAPTTSPADYSCQWVADCGADAGNASWHSRVEGHAYPFVSGGCVGAANLPAFYMGVATPSNSNYTLLNLLGGATFGTILNTQNSTYLGLGVNGSIVCAMSSLGFAIGGGVPPVTGSNALKIYKGTAPTGINDTAHIYVDESGGKDRVMVIFGSGAAVQMAIEP